MLPRCSLLIITSFGVATVVVACASAPSQGPPPRTHQASVSTGTVDAGLLDAAASLDASPKEVDPGPRRGASGDTRGAIACGTKRCKAGEEICAMPDPSRGWVCVPKANETSIQGQLYECDDGTDCASGKTCCEAFSSDAVAFVCTTRDLGCSMEVCEDGGARCPKGQSCQDHYCRPDVVPGPKCGSRVCTGETPLCAWTAGKGECISKARTAELAERGETTVPVLMCTRNADCGVDFHCCIWGSPLGGTQSFCAQACDLSGTHLTCESDADCPTLHPVGGGVQRFHCRPFPGLPSWSRTCTNE